MVRLARLIAISLALTGCGGTSQTADTGQTISTQQAVPKAMRGVEAKKLFSQHEHGSAQPAAPLGSYAKGCLAGGIQLPETGPTWQAMRLSRNRNWGYPETVNFIRDLSAKAARQPGWNGLYIGDIS